MFLHVGADVVVSLKQVIAILDIRSSFASNTTKQFLSAENQPKNVADEVKSLVLTDSGVYLSPISSQTLLKRAHFLETNLTDSIG